MRSNNHLFLRTRDNKTEQRAGLFSARVSSSGLRRILGLSGVDNVRNIAGITVHGVGDLTSGQVRSGPVSGMLYLLQATIREVDEVLALGNVAVPGLCEAVVVLGVIILHPE